MKQDNEKIDIDTARHAADVNGGEMPEVKSGRLRSRFNALVLWRERHISEKTFVVVLALIVGMLGGFAALLLKWLIHIIATFLTQHVAINEGNYIYLVYPAIGILITMLFVRYVVRHNISHGVTRVLYDISQNKSRLKRHNLYSSLCASSVTIGFGGSVGAEGPSVYTGAA